MDTKFTFTMARLEAIEAAPAGKRPLYHDADQPRLCLRVTDTGTKSFYYLNRHAHGLDFIKLGRFPAMTVETARKLARATAAQIDVGENPAEVRRRIRGEPTFRELFDHYIGYLEANRKRRIDDVRSMFERYLGALPDAPVKKHGRKRVKPPEGVNWESRKASKVTADDVARLHKAIGAAGKTTTANRVVEIVSAIYNQAKRDKLIGEMNPATDVEPFPEVERDRHLTSDEAKRFMEALQSEPQQWRDLFLLLLLTGQRLGNVSGMRWRDVDLSAGTWALSGTQTKQRAPIIIPLTTQAAEILQRRRQDTDADAVFVFPGDSTSGHVTRPQKRWERLIERAKLHDVRKHDLRHTAASWLAQSGASLAVIGAALGHRDIKSTMRYAHMTVDPVRAALQGAHDGLLTARPEAAEPAPPARPARPRKPLKFSAKRAATRRGAGQ